MVHIEDYYLPLDGNDWLPAITRAQQEFHTAGDRTGTPGFTLAFKPVVYSFSDTIRLVRSMHLLGAAGKSFSTVFRFATDKGGILCGRRLFGTNLGSPITGAGQTTFSLMSVADIRVDDVLAIDSERVKVVRVSGNNVTVLRGYQETAPTTHPAGAAVALVGYRSDASIIEQILLLGRGTATTAHGITMHVKVTLRDLAIAGFPGDGIHIEASEPAGNANNWHISNIQVNNCGGDGLSVVGTDSGFGYANLLVCQDNAGWAIRDHGAELGNTYISCVAEGTGGGFNTRRPGGASPKSVFINCDVEVRGQSIIDAPAMVINSPIQHLVGNAVALQASATGASFSSAVAAVSPVVPVSTATPPSRGRQVVARLGEYEQILGALSLSVVEGAIDSERNFTSSAAGAPNVGNLELLYDYLVPGWWGLYWDRLNGSPLRISTREADVGEAQIWCEMGIFLGAMLHITASGSSDAAPPTRPGRRSGDIVFNTNPEAGGHVGWVWVQPTGSVGTWKRFGKIES